ncbi:hypothetical protein [Candidatus Symbiobacter mobilis]|uniref:Uncharacterized protein n=1 Tax=Candidatus Symbiobacter mobilis CR TaxID=946483 RepID=U5N9B9_9BURK|nr:hypothetical protein [Candidatus Symbiobacter mobilis]AGX87900.1 hypothetical protein Cenrod_1816 [Candidatus Symbiobacter mobilis CR]
MSYALSIVVEQTHDLIARGDIAGAESALVALADAHGDGALVEAVAQLPVRDVLAIVREFDPGKPSIVQLVLDPEQFASAVVLERNYRDPTHAHLRGMVNAVLFRDGANPLDFLDALAERDGGSEALADYFEEYWAEVIEYARTGSFEPVGELDSLPSEDEMLCHTHGTREWDGWGVESEDEGPVDSDLLHTTSGSSRLSEEEVADTDWKHLAWLLRMRRPDQFSEVLLILRAKARAFALQDAPLPDAASPGSAGLQEESAI